MSPGTRQGPGITAPGPIKITGDDSGTPKGTPDPRHVTAVTIELAAVLADLDGQQLDATTKARTERRITSAVDLLLAVEAVLCRPDVDPDQEAELSARWAELVGGGS